MRKLRGLLVACIVGVAVVSGLLIGLSLTNPDPWLDGVPRVRDAMASVEGSRAFIGTLLGLLIGGVLAAVGMAMLKVASLAISGLRHGGEIHRHGSSLHAR